MQGKLLNEWGMAVGLFLFALLIRVVVLFAHPFDGLYGQDAFAYYDYAHQLWDSARQLQPPAPFYWPLGYPALVMVAFALFGFTPFAAQVVSIVSGALIAPLIFLLTREISPSPAQRARAGAGAILAGLIAAVSGQLLQLSISVMADATAVMWSLLSALALIRYTRTLSLRWLLLTSLTLAFAILTRWVFGTLLLPWLLAFSIAWRDEAIHTNRIRRAATHAMLAALLPLPLLIVQYGALIPSNSIYNAWLVGWDPTNASTRTFNNADGHFEYPLPVGLFYAQPIAHPYYLFPLLMPLLLIGLWAMRRVPLATCLVVVGWFVASYAFLMGIPYENFRFGLTLWPPLVVLVGVGFSVVWTRLTSPHPPNPLPLADSKEGRWRGRWGAVPIRSSLLLLAILSLFGMMFWSVRGLQTFFAAKERDYAVVRWTDNQLPAGSTLITLGLTEYFKYYAPRLHVVELYNQTPDTLAPFKCAREQTTLLVNMANIQTQWANRAPDLNVRWLRDHAGLSEMGRSDAYTLYRVGGVCN